LIEALDDPSLPCRYIVAAALGSLQTPLPNAVPALRRALQDDDWSLRFRSALALPICATSHDGTIADLEGPRRDPNAMVRVGVASSILRLVPSDGPALTELQTAIASQDVALRIWVADGINEAFLAWPSLLPCVIELLADWDDEVREDAARALAKRAKADAGVVAALLKVALTAEAKLLSGLLFALREIGSLASPLANEISATLARAEAWKHPEPIVRRLAANVAEAVPLGPEVLPPLTELLTDKDDWVQEQAAKAILALPSSSDEDKARATETLRAL